MSPLSSDWKAVHALGVSDSPRWSPAPDVHRLFRTGDFRFEFAIRPAADSWFRLADPGHRDLPARRALLGGEPGRYAPWREEAGPVLDGLLGLFSEDTAGELSGGGVVAARTLAGMWEPDFVLLRRDAEGEFRMVGGCVCDPSAWDPACKLGLTLPEIHSPVPSLNEGLGGRIRTFLDRLSPDVTVTRENWGLAAVPERNLHPGLELPRLSRDADPRRVWLRVEHQAFRALPGVGGIVFVLWLTVHPLLEMLTDPVVAERFCGQLETMPEPVARYKGLAEASAGLIRSIRKSAGG